MKSISTNLSLPTGGLRQTLALCLLRRLQTVYTSIRRMGMPSWQKSNSWKRFQQKDLEAFPFYTLGGALFHYLQNNPSSLIRDFEDHDVFHVLFDFPTHMLGEVQLQFFLLGMGKRSLPTCFTIIVGAGLFPEWWSHMKEAFQKGKTATNCTHWPFEHLLEEPLESIRYQIFKQAFPNHLIF